MSVPEADESLRVPAARQGPGPIQPALIDTLDLTVRRLVARTLAGSRRATGVGSGTELAQLRPYEPGDDVRHIDAAASARTAALHVRVHMPERALTTWIVLDLSASMAFGTADRLKADVAEGATVVFTRIGLRRAGSVGVVGFGAAGGSGGLRVLQPRGSRPGLVAVRKLLAAGLSADGHSDAGALAAALGLTFRLARTPGLVVVISDFRDQLGWQRPLGALRLRHSVVAIEVIDPAEAALPAAGRLSLVDPETGSLVRADSASRRLRERFEALERERRDTVASELRGLGVRHVTLATDREWLADLGRGLR